MSTLTQQWTDGHKAHNADAHNRIENAYKCLRLIKDDLNMDRVIDFGCGIGGWLAAAQIHGAKSIQGIEGEWINNSEVVIPRECIRIANLAEEELDYHKSFDLALTIEVAEHLPETSADMFCRSLTKASNYILFSAAIPGQGGIGHINEQPLPYWVKKFWNLGYVPLEPIRPYINGDSSIYLWLQMNLIMFVAYDALIRSERLLRHTRPIGDFYIRYPTVR